MRITRSLLVKSLNHSPAPFKFGKMMIVGLSGVTCGGKTTLASMVKELLSKEGIGISTINQDDHYKPLEELEPVNATYPYNFEIPSAVNFDTLRAAIDRKSAEILNNCSGKYHVIFLEGILLFSDEKIRESCQMKYFVELNYPECLRRRLLRTDYDPPDPPGFFEEVAWPYYEKHKEFIEKNVSGVRFIDGSEPASSLARIVSMDIRKRLISNWIWIQNEPLNSSLLIDFVTSPTCGAISVFLGTTRETFENKIVESLSYEAYDEMARRKMNLICESAREKWPELHKIAVHHRIGTVAVEEVSVAIAASSPHRKDAQDATRYLIDELKRTVPIWKKEIYVDGEATWKSNKECSWTEK